MMNQACTPQGFLAIPLATTTAIGFGGVTVTGTTTFVIPTQANMVLLVAEGANVRWRDDGKVPTPTSGMLMQTSTPPFEYSGNLGQLQMIAVSGTATVDANFYKTVG